MANSSAHVAPLALRGDCACSSFMNSHRAGGVNTAATAQVAAVDGLAIEEILSHAVR